MSSDVVLPGDELCVIEEFLPGRYAYADDRGIVRSSVVGLVKRDLKSHDIDVIPVRGKLLLSYGDVVYGKVVAMLNEKVAVVKICAIHGDNGKLVSLKYTYTGLLHISQISDQPISTIREVLGIGDVVRARIISRWGPPYLISIKSQNLGVIYAICPTCHVEARRRNRFFQCPSCGQVLKRKVPITD